jgi:ribosome biogenesis GTPase / thiamine phosphate phosphatase
MLSSYGWSPELRELFDQEFDGRDDLVPGRVSVQQRGILTLVTDQGEVPATLAGRFVRDAAQGDFPVAGDWVGVALQPDGSGVIHGIVPRRTAFVRRAPADSGQTEQVVAANADVALLVAAMTRDLNLRRLERYLALAWTSGAQPVILLTKADIAEDVDASVAEVQAIAVGVPIIVLSVIVARGLDELAAILEPGKTAVLLGSSGAGKSTLVNRLLGWDRQDTGAVREHDSRGRHTTTKRELIVLPEGGVLVDTPGLRELQLWEGEGGLDAVFADVTAGSGSCRFRDCSHEEEPGCAVRAAWAAGGVTAERIESYRKLQKELGHVASLRDERTRLERSRQEKIIHRAARKHQPRD